MFEIISEDSKNFARTGLLHTLHGKIETPFFMPVATKTAVKFLDSQELQEMQVQCIISNSLVLYLKPGLKVIEKFKGIHEFSKWPKTIFTDSGGFQTGSESFLEKISDKGAFFKSPFDGSKHLIQPEDVIKINETLKTDVVMVLDDMPLPNQSKERIIDSLNRTISWAKRSKKIHSMQGQLLFGIVQGGLNLDLREKGIQKISEIGFDGIALGGLAIGEPSNETKKIVKFCAKHLPKEKPHYLMGVGTPLELLESISQGIDCFDSRFPTKSARHGLIFTFQGNIDLRKKSFAEDEKSLDEKCECKICKTYSKAFLHHLLRTDEPNAKRFLSYHNVSFVTNLLKEIRTSLKENSFQKFAKEFKENYLGKKIN